MLYVCVIVCVCVCVCLCACVYWVAQAEVTFEQYCRFYELVHAIENFDVSGFAAASATLAAHARGRWQETLSLVPTGSSASRTLFKRAADIVLARSGTPGVGISDTQVDVVFAMFSATGARGRGWVRPAPRVMRCVQEV